MSLVLRQRLDRESRDLHEMALVAQDAGSPPRTASMRVLVSVGDVNDNAPRFVSVPLSGMYETGVVEHARPGTQILQLRATDADLGPNGQVCSSKDCDRKLFCPFKMRVVFVY